MSEIIHHKFIILIVVWAVSGLYVRGFVNRDWIPHDDGSLAQSAERVLAGELPHRDFDEIYTGGLSFLYAAAFKILGIKLITIRKVLYVCFLAFVPALYAIALRFASPLFAGAVTLAGVVWSVPNYFAGIPSWYNLFFATFGALALIRHIETGGAKWLFIAGLCGGASFLAKLSGIYYIAAVFLFLAYREQFISAAALTDRTKTSFVFCFCKAAACLLFVGVLVAFIGSRLGPMEILHFLVPPIVICGILLWTEYKTGGGDLRARLKKLLGLLLPFSGGVAIPVVLFLLPYVIADSVWDLFYGVFISPQERLQRAAMNFPPFFTVITTIPYALLLLFPFRPGPLSRQDRAAGIILLILLAVALASAGNFLVYQSIWHSARLLPVVAVLAGCVLMARWLPADSIDDKQRQILFLLVSVTALSSLVQFPFPAPIYFCYTAPLAALALFATVSFQANAPKLLHSGILGFYFFFALFWMNPGYVWDLGVRYTAHQAESLLNIQRAGIRVTESDKRVYTQLVNLIQRHRGTSEYVYAAPDCPEVYFLSGLRNPTRNIFDFLGGPEKELLDVPALLDSRDVKTVVINGTPHFSNRLDPNLAAVMQERFPRALDLGHFTVRWRQ